MDNNSKAGAFIFLGILGLLGIAVLATRQGQKANKAVARATGWEIIQHGHPIASAPVYENEERSISPTLVYENEERWIFVRGPDRLIEEIVIHRKVTEDG